jgi:hypothetical protein
MTKMENRVKPGQTGSRFIKVHQGLSRLIKVGRQILEEPWAAIAGHALRIGTIRAPDGRFKRLVVVLREIL